MLSWTIARRPIGPDHNSAPADVPVLEEDIYVTANRHPGRREVDDTAANDSVNLLVVDGGQDAAAEEAARMLS